MKKVKLSPRDKELLSVIRQREKQFYDIGFSGKALKIFPDLTEKTTEEEELQMIECWIDKYCEIDGQGTPSPELRKAMQILDKICIASYRDGLLAKALSEENSTKRAL